MWQLDWQQNVHQKSVTGLKVSLDKQRLLSVGADRKIQVCSQSGEVLHSIDSFAGVNDCEWFSDTHIVFASDDGSIKLYDMNRAKILTTFRLMKDYPYCLEINRENNLVLVGDTDGQISSFHVSYKDAVNRFIAHSSTVTSISLTERYDELLSSSHDGTARLWIHSLKPLCLRTIVPVPKRCTPISFSSYSMNQRYILCSTLDSSHRLYNRSHSLPESCDPVHIKQYSGHINRKFTIPSAIVSCDNKGYIVSGSDDGKLHFWDADTEALLDTVSAHEGPVLTFSIHQNQANSKEFSVLSGGADGEIKQWTLRVPPVNDADTDSQII